MTLDGPRRDALSGQATSLVILAHGYGADGNDLIGLGEAMAEHLSDTMWVSPNAPQPCRGNPGGFQWFPIPFMDGSSEDEMLSAFETAQDLLNTYLDDIADETGIPASRTALVGFSQGTMMSLHVGPRRSETFAGIVGFSGRLLAPETLEDEKKTMPPVLLVHGDMDDLVPPENMTEARDGLSAAGFDVRVHLSRGIGHGIAPDGLRLALGFLQEKLGA